VQSPVELVVSDKFRLAGLMHCYYQGSVKIEKMMLQVDEVAEGMYRIETRISGVHTLFTIYFIKDNGGALGELAQLFPEAKVVVNSEGE
jgi:hypothetical protein